MEMLQSIVERIGCLKARAVSPGATKEFDRKQTGKLRCPIVCHKCWQEGHLAGDVLLAADWDCRETRHLQR